MLLNQTVTKHDVTIVQHRTFSHGNIISVVNFPVLDCSQNDRMFNARTIVQPLKYLSQYNSFPF